MERIMHLVPVASQPSQSSAAISGFHRQQPVIQSTNQIVVGTSLVAAS